MAEKCIWLLSNRIASSGGIWPVDIFPFLKYIPTWVPGMAFKRNAAKWKAQMEEFVDGPYNFVEDNIVSIMRFVFERMLYHLNDRVLESRHCASFFLQDIT
jgi:hypothetical protein